MLYLMFGRAANGDTLHGFCPNPANCNIDVNLGGGLSGSQLSPGTAQFGFYAAPGPQSGNDYLVILSPTPLSAPTLAYTNVAGSPTTTTTFKGTWSSGGLNNFLGLDATANNPFGNYGGPNGIDAGVSQFYVYEVNLGTQTVQPQSTEGGSPLFSVNGGLAAGDFVLDFLDPPGWSTPNSAVLEVTPTFSAPEPSSLSLLAIGLLGLLGLTRRR